VKECAQWCQELVETQPQMLANPRGAIGGLEDDHVLVGLHDLDMVDWDEDELPPEAPTAHLEEIRPINSRFEPHALHDSEMISPCIHGELLAVRQPVVAVARQGGTPKFDDGPHRLSRIDPEEAGQPLSSLPGGTQPRPRVTPPLIQGVVPRHLNLLRSWRSQSHYAASRGSSVAFRNSLLFTEHVLEPGVFARVGAAETRNVTTGAESAQLLIIGGTPGKAYQPLPIVELGGPESL
jgi:hypothetical protein